MKRYNKVSKRENNNRTNDIRKNDLQKTTICYNS